MLLILVCLVLFCSIEFDRDCDYFAIAGVTKKIKVSAHYCAILVYYWCER